MNKTFHEMRMSKNSCQQIKILILMRIHHVTFTNENS